ncbi:hypothetical protein ABW19_dt0202054 [Dactylella cylindrospora]|nr:hypothetical protein ABW19_dt0202054 [Dactylella cylindrospora]
MPSFASFSKPLTIGHGKDKKSYPPTSMKAPFLPEPLHVDTSDILASVQSVPSPLDNNNFPQDSQEFNRPAWHTSDPYSYNEPGFSGGHHYKVERMEERRRLRSLGLLSGSTTPLTETSLSSTPTAVTMAAPVKPETKRRSSWQPPIKGKLQKARNKSKDPENRKSMDTKHVPIEYQSPPAPPPQYTFSRIHNAPASPMGSPCVTPSPMMTPTRDMPPPRPPFTQVGRSSSSLGTLIGVATTTPSTSLGNLVDYYDPNSPGQAFSTAPSSPIVPLHNYSQPSSQTASPMVYQRPQYSSQNSPVDSTAPAPLFSGRIHSTTPTSTPPRSKNSHLPPVAAPIIPSSRANSSTTSVNSSVAVKPAEKNVEKPAEKPAHKPYEPRYAAKSHVTSTVPLTQTVNQDQPPVPFVHLDFTPPPKPFARPQLGQHRNNSDTRLTTQEAKEYNAIAQATREAHARIQSPSEISLVGKGGPRPQLTPSRLSHEVRSTPSPDHQPRTFTQPPKSILRKPVELPAEEPQQVREEPSSSRRQPPSLQVSARTTPEPFGAVSRTADSEPVSPINPPAELEAQPERGRTMFKRGEDPNVDLNRRPSVSARKSIDVETPSAKNFDISKYTQERFSKPASGKASRSYPPVSYKPPQTEHSPSYSPEPSTNVPPVPPLPELANTMRGLSTPPPIRSDNAIDSSDDESVERPSTAHETRRTSDVKGKSKLSSSTTPIESAPMRPRAPSMTEILKDLHNYEAEEGISPEPSEGTDWLSQLFRGKKTDVKLPSRPSSGVSTPVSMSPPVNGNKLSKKGNHSRNSSKTDITMQEQLMHERAERQRLEVERKLAEAESEPSTTPRSPRFPRPSVSVTASPDLRVNNSDAASLRTSSTASVDRLDPVVGGSSNLGKAEEIPEGVILTAPEKKQDRKRRPSSAEVRKQLGEMTPPHEREDWEVTRNSQSSMSSLPLISPPIVQSTPAPPSPLIPTVAPLKVPTKAQVPGRLPIPNVVDSPSTSTSSQTKDSLLIDARSSSSSLLSLDSAKTLTKIMVVCCNCNRLHDPPNEIYRRMVQGNSSFKCPYCIHKINVLDCCSAYTSICNLIEKLH